MERRTPLNSLSNMSPEYRYPTQSKFSNEYHSSTISSRLNATELNPIKDFENKLTFHYSGDVFHQRGNYTDGRMYLSRLSPLNKNVSKPDIGRQQLSSQSLSKLPEPKDYENNTSHGRVLTPMNRNQGGTDKTISLLNKTMVDSVPMVDSYITHQSSSSTITKIRRKRQYARAVQTMASNALFHTSLLSDNVVANIVALCRTNDIETLSACISTLCHFSTEKCGREAILANNAIIILSTFVISRQNHVSEQRNVLNAVSALANLTIEDSYEAIFIKDKALEAVLKFRMSSSALNAICKFSLFNLTCSLFQYPRLDDVTHCIIDYGKDHQAYDEILSQAVYNLCCIRTYQLKLIEHDVLQVLQQALRRTLSEIVCQNALHSIYHLCENSNCRKQIFTKECITLIVNLLLQVDESEFTSYKFASLLSILLKMPNDISGRDVIAHCHVVQALVNVAKRINNVESQDMHLKSVRLVMYRILAIFLSIASSTSSIDQATVDFFLFYKHDTSPEISVECIVEDLVISRYVLFALATILSWSDNVEIDNILDENPDNLLEKFHHHIFVQITPKNDFIDVYLQLLLLYNISFRYDKVQVATLCAVRLREIVLETKNHALLSLVTNCYFSICQEYDAHTILLQQDILQSLYHLLMFGTAITQMMTLEVVSLLLDGKKLSKLEIQRFVEKLFFAIISHCEAGSAVLRRAAAGSIARFAVSPECRLMMVKNGIIVALSNLSTEQDEITLHYCVSTYSLLSCDNKICSDLIRNDIIKSLIFLAAAPQEKVRRACAMTLCNLSTSEEHLGTIVRQGAFRALLVVSCVKSNDPETRRICMKAVMNLLRQRDAIPQMCTDGLLWAFDLFTQSMKPRDFEIMCDAFCALSFYPVTREKVVKFAILTSLFQAFEPQHKSSMKTKITLLKGLSNVLCELPIHATALIQAGLFPHLIVMIETQSEKKHQQEVHGLVAQILVVLLQACPVSELEMSYSTITCLFRNLAESQQQNCGQSCAMILHLLSIHKLTRAKLINSDTQLLSYWNIIFQYVNLESQIILIRCIFNLSCDNLLLQSISTKSIIIAISSTISSFSQEYKENAYECLLKRPFFQTLPLVVSAIFYNLSSNTSCHNILTQDYSITSLKILFNEDCAKCKEHSAFAICNIMLGNVNSNALLQQGVLPLILWLCMNTSSGSNARALCSAILRKVAIPPGNIAMLVDGDVIRIISVLMYEDAELNIQFTLKNYVATYCLIARKLETVPLIASYGIIASTLSIIKSGNYCENEFESMCVDLLSILAAHARLDDPRENNISSVLYQLIEREERPAISAINNEHSEHRTFGAWQNDRSFLDRSECGSLSFPELVTQYKLSQNEIPPLRHVLYPIECAGYMVDFTHANTQQQLRIVVPVPPSMLIIGETLSHNISIDDEKVVVAPDSYSCTEGPLISPSTNDLQLSSTCNETKDPMWKSPTISYAPPPPYQKRNQPFPALESIAKLDAVL